MERFGRVERLSTSPGSLRAITMFTNQIDVTSVLGSVHVPTLVLHRQGDANVPVEQGRELAALIPGARLIEYPGGDHAFWTGDTKSLLADIEAFAAGRQRDEARSPRAGPRHGAVRCRRSGRCPAARADRAPSRRSCSGKRRGPAGHFRRPQPRRAVRPRAGEIGQGDRPALRAGLHTGEIDPRGPGGRGPAFDAARSVMSRSRPGEVLVSRVITDLVAGSGLSFTERESYEVEGLAGRSEPYAANPWDLTGGH